VPDVVVILADVNHHCDGSIDFTIHEVPEICGANASDLLAAGPRVRAPLVGTLAEGRHDSSPEGFEPQGEACPYVVIELRKA
jgi:hypothetical protein